MKKTRNIFQLALLAISGLFVVTQWRGMSFTQRYVLGFVVYLLAGMVAMLHGSRTWCMAWLMAGVAALCVGVVLLACNYLGLWGRKRN